MLKLKWNSRLRNRTSGIIVLWISCTALGDPGDHRSATNADQEDQVKLAQKESGEPLSPRQATLEMMKGKLHRMSNSGLSQLIINTTKSERLSPRSFDEIIDALPTLDLDSSKDALLKQSLKDLYLDSYYKFGDGDARQILDLALDEILSERLKTGGFSDELLKAKEALLGKKLDPEGLKKKDGKPEGSKSEAKKALEDMLANLNKKFDEILNAKNDPHDKNLKPEDLAKLLKDLPKNDEKGGDDDSGGGDKGGGDKGGGGGSDPGGGSGKEDSGKKPKSENKNKNDNLSKNLPKANAKKNDEKKESKKPEFDSKKKTEKEPGTSDKDKEKNSLDDALKNAIGEEPAAVSSAPKPAGNTSVPGPVSNGGESVASGEASTPVQDSGGADLGAKGQGTQASPASLGDGDPFGMIGTSTGAVPQPKFTYIRTSENDLGQGGSNNTDADSGEGSGGYGDYSYTSKNTDPENATLSLGPAERKPSSAEGKGLFSESLLARTCEGPGGIEVGVCGRWNSWKKVGRGNIFSAMESALK